ncbi:MAG: GNAT family N-acetyltransferase [Actinomycetota bacterium]
MTTIRPFRAGDQNAAKALILAGLVEHWGILDEAANPDLDDLAASYRDATILVAVEGNQLVGTGILVPTHAGSGDIARESPIGEIVRMSVDGSQRRRGVGIAVLDALCAAARAQGMSRLVLETTASWSGVVAFYERYGFRHTHDESSPYGTEAHFALALD